MTSDIRRSDRPSNQRGSRPTATFDPQVSVIITTCNRARFLESALRSVLAQTYPHLEITIVDDASTDRTQELVATYRDPRILYHRNPRNEGGAAARNRGVSLCRGELVGFLDDDDRWEPEKIQRQVEAFAADPGLGWVYTGWKWIDAETGRVQHRRCPGSDGRIDGLPRWAFNIAIDFLARRELLEQFPSDRALHYYIPCDLLLRLAMSSRSAFVPEVLVRCTSHGGPRTSDRRATQKLADLARLIDRYGDFIRSDRPAWAHLNLIRGALLVRELGNSGEGRKVLLEALRAQPHHWKIWAYLFRSLLPRKQS